MSEYLILLAVVAVWDMSRRWSDRGQTRVSSEDFAEHASDTGEHLSNLTQKTDKLEAVIKALETRSADHTTVLTNHAETLAAQGRTMTNLGLAPKIRPKTGG